MLIECCSKQLLEYEIKNRIRELKKGESVEFKIESCKVLDKVYDLKIDYSQREHFAKEKR